MKKTFAFWKILNSIPRNELLKLYNAYTNLSQINVALGQTGLGRQAANNDKISGLLSYNANGLPAGFGTTAVQFITNLAQAETLGILPTGNYTYEHYHISEFFRINPNGWLYVGIYAFGLGTFAEIQTMILAAGGNIRQLGVYAWGHAWSSADVTTIQAVWAGIPVGYQQFSIIYAPDFSAIVRTTGWGTVTNLRTLNAQKVSVIIAQDAGGTGNSLFTTGLKSVQALGTLLGCISLADVNESVGNPANFPLSDGVNMASLALANGDLINTLGYNTLDTLLGDGYIVARQYLPDITGSYFERIPTCVPLTNNYAWLEIVRAVDKLIRGVRTSLTPYLQYSIGLNANGTMTNDSIGFFKDLAQTPADQMVANGEISAALASIDPTQNVLSTSKLILTLSVIPVGISGQITVNINLVTSLPTTS